MKLSDVLNEAPKKNKGLWHNIQAKRKARYWSCKAW